MARFHGFGESTRLKPSPDHSVHVELSKDWLKVVKDDLFLLTSHEQKMEVAFRAYEALNEDSPVIEESRSKSLKLAAKHALQACIELLRVEIQMIGKISPKLANELEADLNKWQRKAVKEIDDKGYDYSDSTGIIDIRNRVLLVRRIMQDTVDSLEEFKGIVK